MAAKSKTHSPGYVVLCDHLLIDQANKITLVGVFDRVFVEAIPSKQEACFLAAEIVGVPGPCSVMIRIKDDKGAEVVPALGPLNLELSSYGTARITMRIANLPLLRLGQYRFVVSVDGQDIGERVLFIEKRGKVNK